MPLRWIIHLMALAFVWFGLQDTWTWLRNRTPTTATCAGFAQARPSAAWLDLSGCVADYSEAVRVSKSGRVTGERDARWLVPLRAADDTGRGPVHLVTEVRDSAAILLEQLHDLTKGRPDADLAADTAVGAFLETHAAALGRSPVTLRGLVASGMRGDSRLDDLLEREKPWTLAEDWAILLPDEEPQGPVSMLLSLLGMLWLGRAWRRWSRSAAEEEAREAAAAAAGPARVADLADPPA